MLYMTVNCKMFDIFVVVLLFPKCLCYIYNVQISPVLYKIDLYTLRLIV